MAGDSPMLSKGPSSRLIRSNGRDYQGALVSVYIRSACLRTCALVTQGQFGFVIIHSCVSFSPGPLTWL